MAKMRYGLALFLIAGAILMVELALTRVFDVIVAGNIGYVVITSAMFALGLAGVYGALRPVRQNQNADTRLAAYAAAFAFLCIALLPMLNRNPFWFDKWASEPAWQSLLFAGMYVSLVLPFFFAGLVLSTLFSVASGRIRALYCWDLAGAALGCVAIVPLLRPIGVGGILFVAAGLALVGAALFGGRRAAAALLIPMAALLVALPFLRADYFDFRFHADKRGLFTAAAAGLVEHTEWDPISRIDIYDDFPRVVPDRPDVHAKHIAYDGGNQSSYFYAFDGDLPALRALIEAGDPYGAAQFWQRGLLASHYLKRDSDARVLIIGSAGGQETKAALLFNPKSIDGIELVWAVVRLGKTTYNNYLGGIFNDPRVHNRVGEGRSFLRATPEKFDVIQEYSNHTSSSIASGTGAVQTTYLQTAEAYQEYLTHLTDNGILHINHHIFPRMVTTAALAWKELGWSDFSRHLVIFEAVGDGDNLPTVLIKRSPWTAAEMDELLAFMAKDPDDKLRQTLLHHPLRPQESFLSPEFFSGSVPPPLLAQVPYRITPCTDDRPYFNFLSTQLAPIATDPARYVSNGTGHLMRNMAQGILPADIKPLVFTGMIAVLFAAVFTLGPLTLSRVGREPWRGKLPALAYFSCLGVGFIVVELVFIQVFMKLIGFPLYAYTLVIFTMLLAAGLGSGLAQVLGIDPTRRWWTPFLGTLVLGVAAAAGYPALIAAFIAHPLAVRLAVAAAVLLPLGLFMGMAFPLGVLAIKDKPDGAVAWAWAMNGLFTIVGGVAATALSIFIGFRLTLYLGLLAYVLAFATFAVLRRGVAVAAVSPDAGNSAPGIKDRAGSLGRPPEPTAT